MPTPTAPSTPDDTLFDLEHRIARRADEIARSSPSPASPALEHWLQAEHEIWQHTAPPPPVLQH